ncbi:CpsD/CapB family tyrosine-protein kinase [Methylobacter sp.]|uniref:CpsD/CapB family tyrosine-protein kinase n=1 Tax=Methylobacter sp. TaxID=2051955 RepID=UPI0012219C1B|nr:CpsD/CapB family tyrosine-protein kinase [Methylobacter sp.]TAK60457.1 MAG: exopolysaccharide biosynthesis protein [Methylobacter sp.]
MSSKEATMEKSNPPTNNHRTLPADSEQFSYTQTRIQTTHSEHLQKNRIITGFKPGKWLESYKMLRTRCLQVMDGMNWNTLAITSPGNGTGNSLTAANLAISIAMELNRSVLLVDANFQNPSICKLFGINAKAGLGDYLLNDAPLNEILINPDVDRLVILPAGKEMFNSTEMLRSPKMIRLVNELKTRYPSRIIIFDLPPLLSQADTLGFSPYVDCVLLVVNEGHTKTEELKHAASLLKEINVLGTVLNKASDNKIKYQAN